MSPIKTVIFLVFAFVSFAKLEAYEVWIGTHLMRSSDAKDRRQPAHWAFGASFCSAQSDPALIRLPKFYRTTTNDDETYRAEFACNG